MIVVTLALGAMLIQVQSNRIQANNYCCSSCGCCQQPRKVCRLKCEMKPVTTFEYGCECEDVCMPGPSKRCGSCWVPDCSAWCGCRKEIKWQPTCSCHIRKRVYLTKVPVTKDVPVYTCVVECVCTGCGCCQVDQKATEEARAKNIMPASAEEPIVLQEGGVEKASFDDQSKSTAKPAANPLSRIFHR
jgi:hypothetical protein